MTKTQPFFMPKFNRSYGQNPWINHANHRADYCQHHLIGVDQVNKINAQH
jgi:hypothetical protein